MCGFFLRKDVSFNGVAGRILGTSEESAGRVVVSLQPGQCISVKSENLVLLDMEGASQATRVLFHDSVCGHALAAPFRYPISLRKPPSRAEMEASRAWWSAHIQLVDRVLWLRADEDIYRYLVIALARVLKTKTNLGRKGSSGWTWKPCPIRDIRCGWVLSKGGHEQEVRMNPYEVAQWWPTIFYITDANAVVECPSYCPGLAVQQARPWCAHRSNLIETPGVHIEELPDVAISQLDDSWTLV